MSSETAQSDWEKLLARAASGEGLGPWTPAVSKTLAAKASEQGCCRGSLFLELACGAAQAPGPQAALDLAGWATAPMQSWVPRNEALAEMSIQSAVWEERWPVKDSEKAVRLLLGKGGFAVAERLLETIEGAGQGFAGGDLDKMLRRESASFLAGICAGRIGGEDFRRLLDRAASAAAGEALPVIFSRISGWVQGALGVGRLSEPMSASEHPASEDRTAAVGCAKAFLDWGRGLDLERSDFPVAGRAMSELPALCEVPELAEALVRFAQARGVEGRFEAVGTLPSEIGGGSWDSAWPFDGSRGESVDAAGLAGYRWSPADAAALRGRQEALKALVEAGSPWDPAEFLELVEKIEAAVAEGRGEASWSTAPARALAEEALLLKSSRLQGPPAGSRGGGRGHGL